MNQSDICVCIRKRPTNNNDIININNNFINVIDEKIKVDLQKHNKIHKYKYDYVFPDNINTQFIYKKIIKKFVYNISNNINSVCYAYGQTGSGKTFTILGDNNHYGLLTFTIDDLFKNQSQIKISCYEIYNNKLYDLFNDRKLLFIREGYNYNQHIKNLKYITIESISDYFYYINLIVKYRQNGISGQNNNSSRSHLVFTIIINNNYIKFIDLAGSERAKKSIFINKQIFKENAEINKSLLALKECIRSIINNKNHIPFRNSKLTTVLRDSFTKNCNTIIIGTISANKNNIVDTLNTLNYTSNIKYIKKLDFKDIKKKKKKKFKIKNKTKIKKYLPKLKKNNKFSFNDYTLFMEDFSKQISNQFQIYDELKNNNNIDSYKNKILETLDNQIILINNLKNKILFS